MQTETFAKTLENKSNINTDFDNDTDGEENIENKYNTIINQNITKKIKQTDRIEIQEELNQKRHQQSITSP